MTENLIITIASHLMVGMDINIPNVFYLIIVGEIHMAVGNLCDKTPVLKGVPQKFGCITTAIYIQLSGKPSSPIWFLINAFAFSKYD